MHSFKKHGNIFRSQQVEKALSAVPGLEGKEFLRQKIMEYGNKTAAFQQYRAHHEKKYPDSLSFNHRYQKREAEQAAARDGLVFALRQLAPGQADALIMASEQLVGQTDRFWSRFFTPAHDFALSLASNLKILLQDARKPPKTPQ